MAICYDSSRKLYYISYRLTLPTGETKSRKIRNTERTRKRVVQQIELDEIEKDKEKILKSYHKKKDTFENLVDIYFRQCELTKKDSTNYGNKLVFKNYIFPCLDKSLSLEAIFEPSNMLSLVGKIKDLCKTKNVTTKRLNISITLLRELYDQAFQLDLISANSYNKGKLLLKHDKVVKVKTEKLMFWTPEQFDQFIATFDKEDQKWKMFFEVAYWGAFRIGEILALKRGDFNYEKKTLNVNKTIDKNGKISTTKNKASIDDVEIPDKIADELLEYRKSYNNPFDSDYMFFIKHTSRTSTKRIMDKHIKMANLPHIKFHSLRHSMASRMINAGVLPLYVSKHLRHASTQQTLDTYSHLFPKVGQGIMNQI